jgi:phosphate/phosphite/phosphonate ABC transporter binding protein
MRFGRVGRVKFIRSLLFVLLCLPVQSGAVDREVRIGILANRGTSETMEKWHTTALYLSKEIPGYSFVVVPLGFREIGPMVKGGKVDFILANSSIYVELQSQYGVTRIATMKNIAMKRAETVFGGVIISRSDRRDIENLKDLKGKSFMAVEENSFGGWQIGWYEMKKVGINPFSDLKSLTFGGTHDNVVYAVRDGKADAGTVRTDVLERMAEKGEIDLKAFHIINEKKQEGFPFLLSSDLYPEWPFAMAKHIQNELAEKVAISLIKMQPDNPAALIAKIAGWSIPHDYLPVENLMKELRIGPFVNFGSRSVGDVVREYFYLLIVGVTAVFLLLFLTLYVGRLNVRLSLSRKKIKKNAEELEAAYTRVSTENTERVQAEARVRQQFDFTRTILDSINDSIAIIDISSMKIIDVNSVFLKEHGLSSQEEVIGRTCYEVTHKKSSVCGPPDDICPISETLKTGKHSSAIHFHYNHKGKRRHIEVSTSPIVESSGAISRVVHVSRDITTIRMAEVAIAEGEIKSRKFIETSQDMVYETDAGGTFVMINQAGAEMLGYPSPWEVIGMKAQSVWRSPDDRMKYIDELQKTGMVKSYPIPALRADGALIDLESTSMILLDANGEFCGIQGIIRDATERKLAETLLRRQQEELKKAYNDLKQAQSRITQQEKMASIGQLAAGVAHEINNPTGFIMSNLGSLQKYIDKLACFVQIQQQAICDLPAESMGDVLAQRKSLKIDFVLDDLGNLIKESLEGAERINKIVQDLKNFSRIDEAEQKMADINAGIESTLNIVWNELKYKAKVKKEYGDIPETRCNPGQLNQVFMNLLVNAAHAIEKEGEIGIRSWLENHCIFISISDTGCGIADDKLNRIFEPFYTTKEIGKGTGLGLSIVYDIVKKHNGDIQVRSEMGKGTTFTVMIPVTGGESNE